MLGSVLACCRILSVGRKQKKVSILRIIKMAIQNVTNLMFNLLAGVHYPVFEGGCVHHVYDYFLTKVEIF